MFFKFTWHQLLIWFIAAVYCNQTVPESPVDSVEAEHDADFRQENDTGRLIEFLLII